MKHNLPNFKLILKSTSVLRMMLVLLLAFVGLSGSGCAGLNKRLKSLVGVKSDEEQKLEQVTRKSTAAKFSEQDNMRIGTERQYRRMNRQRFEEEADVGSQAGSLWVPDGQAAYWTAQNTIRVPGDNLVVKLDGAPRKQLETKTRVISKLLDRLDRSDAPIRGPANKAGAQPGAAQANAQQAAGANPAGAGNPAGTAPGANPADPNAPPGAGPENANANAGKQDPKFDVNEVPTRIIETLRDGSYRVKGLQSMMIGKREYKVIVTGIVRPEDFNEEGISAMKLIDGQFDIVSGKKSKELL